MTHLKRRLTHILVAIIPCWLAYKLSEDPKVDRKLVSQVSEAFQWKRWQIDDPTNATRRIRHTMNGGCGVHPSLCQVESWISAVGAAVTAADLDQNGLCDDLVHVDPRSDEITVMKAPFSRSRVESYSNFSLMPAGETSKTALHLSYGPPEQRKVAGVAPMGTLVADYDQDGAMDILAYYWGRSPIVFIRIPEQKLTEGSKAFRAVELLDEPEIWHTNAGVQGDLDGDGTLDLVFGNFFADHAPVLVDQPAAKDVTTLTLARLPGATELADDPRRTPQMQASKAKATNGGDLHFFKGQRGGKFTQLPARGEGSILQRRIDGQWVLAIGAADLDRDGRLDLYVANDFGPDLLLSNRSGEGGAMKFVACYGKKDFTAPKSCVVGYDSFKGMGVCIADVNGDGLLDIQVGNIDDTFALQESHLVWLHTGDLGAMKRGTAPYTHAAEHYGLARIGWEWDTKCADFNNDGQIEVVQACGYIRGKNPGWASLHSVAMMNALALNGASHWVPMRDGIDISGGNLNGFFVRNGEPYFNLNKAMIEEGFNGAPFPEPMVSRAIAISDMDGDGWVDFAIANQWGSSWIYQNQAGRTRHADGARGAAPEAKEGFSSLALSVVDFIQREGKYGSSGNASPAFGATVTIQPVDDGVPYAASWKQQTAIVDVGSGHAGRSAPEVYFGLASCPPKKLFKVTVDWGVTSSGEPRHFHTNVDSSGKRWAVILKGNEGGEVAAQPIPLPSSATAAVR